MPVEPITRQSFSAWMALPSRHALIMGILNVTPDSFSDGGQFLDPTTAADQAMRMLDDGADIIDVGGESTRPGAEPVSPEVQIRRTVPVIQEIVRRRAHSVISIDTSDARVAEAAIQAGAIIVNDVSAARNDEQMFGLVQKTGAFLVLMHMQGTPGTMQQNPQYYEVVSEVESFLRGRVRAACERNIDSSRLLVDPGIGFGKAIEHNLKLLAATRRLASMGVPLLIGTSRKGFIGHITSEPEPRNRLIGSCVTSAYVVANGASVVRVHDVKPTRQAIDMINAITRSVQE